MGEMKAVFKCIRGCAGSYPLDRILYTCPKCGGLLEVAHDIDALRQRPGEEWRRLFDARAAARTGLPASGIWSKREFVLPTISDGSIVSLGEGYTPLVHAGRLGGQLGLDRLWVKLCGNSHTGSFKDLGMTVLVSQVCEMIARGAGIRAVACASTGDTSASLAAYCAAAGLLAIVLLPENKVSTAQLLQPLAHGALTLALETDFDGCMALVKKLTAREEIYLANSMNSLRIEGQKTIAIELAQQLGWRAPHWVVVPGGNLGNISAIAKGFEMAVTLGLIGHRPRLVCAQAANANPLYESYQRGFATFTPKAAATTLASAIQIGNPVSVEKAITALRQCNGVVEQASEAELADAAALADRSGLYCCPHTGVALAAARKLARRGMIGRGEEVVVIATAHGLKFSEFKLAYHEGNLREIGTTHANTPQKLPATEEAVLAAVGRALPGQTSRRK